MRRPIISGLLTPFLILFGFFLVTSGSWDDLKLRVAPYRSYLTLRNNPLLTGADADLQTVSRQSPVTPRIALTELLPGGPPKDGIPAIDNPRFETKESTTFPHDELILGIALNGEARAYPYGILNWHEIVNDTVGDLPVTITYCPLCDTGIAFERVINGRPTTFGVSGKLYQSCLVMYDRLTDSLWSQPWGLGIVGDETNSVLRRIPAYKTTLGAWLKRYPDSRILSADTGHSRNYYRYPYGAYFTSSSLIFPVRNRDRVTGHIKDIVYIIWESDDHTPFDSFSGRSRPFLLREIEARGVINGAFGGDRVAAVIDKEIGAVRVFMTTKEVMSITGDERVIYRDGEEKAFTELREIPVTSSFAFVYPAFFE